MCCDEAGADAMTIGQRGLLEFSLRKESHTGGCRWNGTCTLSKVQSSVAGVPTGLLTSVVGDGQGDGDIAE
jgi:hypothetical protein